MEYVTSGIAIQVDKEDISIVNSHNWYIDKRGYLYTKDGVKTIFLHRLIMKAEKEQEIDHRFGNLLDFRKENLRFCTSRQNKTNQIKRVNNKTTSKYKGVSLRKPSGKWLARCDKISLGYFDSEIEAAYTYDKKAKKLFGEFAKLNFPEVNNDKIN